MNVMIHKVTIGGKEVTLGLADEAPIASIDGKNYTALSDFFSGEASLVNSGDWDSLAIISNFLLQGLEYRVINDFLLFQKEYADRIEGDQSNSSLDKAHFSAYGIYDVNTITSPYMKNGQLTFYCEREGTGVPYKATLPFPYTDPEVPSTYDLLPPR